MKASNKTLWRRAIKRQLEHSELPLESDNRLRDYAEVLFNLSSSKKLETLDCNLVLTAESAIREFAMQEHEKFLLRYTANLLMDHINGRESAPIKGLTITCGNCGCQCSRSASGSHYICSLCSARAQSDAGGVPLGIPVLAKMGSERSNLHNRLDKLWKNRSERSMLYFEISKFLQKPIQQTHIGYVCTDNEVTNWHQAIDHVQKLVAGGKLWATC